MCKHTCKSDRYGLTELLCRFDTIYLGRTLRVAKDIRGDTLVVERDGPPRSFS